MMMRRAAALLIIAIIVSMPAASFSQGTSAKGMEFKGEGTPISLDEAINMVLENSPEIRQCELDMEKAEVESKRIKDLKEADEKVIEYEKYIDYLSASTIRFDEHLTLRDITAEYIIDDARRTYEAKAEGIKAGVEELYYGLLQAGEAAAINSENCRLSLELHEKAKKKFELGIVAKQEVLNSELNYISALNEYKASQNTLASAKMAFNAKLGKSVMTEVKPADDALKLKELTVESIESAVEQALSKRYEVKSAEFSLKTEQLNMKIAEKLYAARLIKKDTDYREQEIKLMQAEKALEDLKRSIEMEVRINYLDVLQKKDEIESGEKSVELAEEMLKISEASYDAGLGLMTDVQKAQIALKQSKLGLSKAIMEYNLAVLKFEDSIGVGRK